MREPGEAREFRGRRGVEVNREGRRKQGGSMEAGGSREGRDEQEKAKRSRECRRKGGGVGRAGGREARRKQKLRIYEPGKQDERRVREPGGARAEGIGARIAG